VNSHSGRSLAPDNCKLPTCVPPLRERYNRNMATDISALLAGTTTKQKAEATNFEAFRRAQPNFVGRSLIRIQWGGDPPDVLCLDASGSRIGVELVQWVNQRQMATSKRRFKVEDSYRRAIRSPEVEPPANIGLVFIYAKDTTPLAPENSTAFRDELYKFVRAVDDAWQLNPDWDDPQGYTFTDFRGYPTLAQYVEGLDFYARGRRFDPQLGADWLTFRAHGGAYTPDWMRDALLENIKRKITKYDKPHNKLKLQQQRLAEFYLLTYYDEAVLHNTPYDAPGFGFREIAALVTRELAANPHPFDKVFLYSPIEKAPVSQAWPPQE
jgi:hypothetical protein